MPIYALISTGQQRIHSKKKGDKSTSIKEANRKAPLKFVKQ